MVISLNSLPEHIFRSVLDKVYLKDLLQFAQSNKFTDQYLSQNASRLQNGYQSCFLEITSENIVKLEQKQYLPGKIVISKCDMSEEFESEEMRSRFVRVCEHWRLETVHLVFKEAKFFIEAVRATSPEHVVIYNGKLSDQHILLYPEMQKLKNLDINHLIGEIPIEFVENCCCKSLRMHLSKIGAEVRVLLQRFISGSFSPCSWILMVNTGIDPSIFFSLTAGFDIKLYWKRDVTDLPLSHKNPLHIRPSVVALFSLTNVKGETIFVKLFQTELDICEIENPENVLFEAWDAIRNSSAYPL